MKKHRIAYLTIDDVPTDDIVNKLNFLEERKIPAILCIIGRSVNKRRLPLLVEAIRKGFLIGNHSWNHPNFSEITRKEIVEEITKTDKLIDSLYKNANVERTLKVFRFPYLQKGAKDKKFTQQLLKELGYKQPIFDNLNDSWHQEGHEKDLDVFMTFDTYDWALANKSHVEDVNSLNDAIAKIDKLKNSKNNEIIMMHDDGRITEMFQPMINKFLEVGFVFDLPN